MKSLLKIGSYFRFSLNALFAITFLVALATWFYVRAKETVDVCSGLYALDCPTLKSGSLPKSEYMLFCNRMCSMGGFPRNAIHWEGGLWAVAGKWETNRYVVFTNPGLLDPLFKYDEKILKLLLRLRGLDEIVICDSGYPDVLNEPHVKKFLIRLRQHHPNVRVTAQKCSCLG